MSLALTLVESMGWVASGALVALVAVVAWRGLRVHLYVHDDDDDARP